MSEENGAIQTLTHISDALAQESASAKAVRIDDPVSAIDSSLSDFVRDSFSQVQEDRKFKEAIKEAILTRLNEANVKDLMSFYRDVQSGEIGATSILVSPLANIETAKVQAEAEAGTYNSSSSAVMLEDKVFKKAGKDVLQGIVQLNQLLEALNAAKTVTAEVIEDKKA